jgi:hypothetical protein
MYYVYTLAEKWLVKRLDGLDENIRILQQFKIIE